MNCPIDNRNLEMVVAYAAGRLDPETAQAFRQHMESCTACRLMAEEQSSVWSALDIWETPPISPDFDQRLYRCIQTGAPLSWWQTIARALHSMPMRQVIPLGATAGLLLAAGFILQQPDKIATARPGVRTVRVEQVERTLDDMDLLGQFSASTPSESAQHNAL